MKVAHTIRFLAPLLLALVNAGCLAWPSRRDAVEGSDSSPALEFLSDLEDARRKSAVTGRPVVLIFGALWCSSCRAFRLESLGAPSILQRGGEFHWVFSNIDLEPSLARQYGVVGTPQLFVLDAGGRVLAQALGNLPPREFGRFLDAALARAELARISRLPSAPPEPVRAEDVTQLTWTPDGYRAASICFSQVGYGPFDVPSQSPPAVLRLSPKPRTPSTLARGQSEVRWNENIANFWAYKPGRYRLDYGALTSTLAITHGLTNTVQLEIELFDFRRFESSLDGITDTFHEIFGLSDSGREEFPRGENVIEVNGVSSVDQSTYSDDVSVTVQHNVTCGTIELPAFSYALTARTNLGGNVPVGGGTDLSLGLSTAASRRFSEDCYAYLGLSYLWHGRDEWRGLSLEQTQYAALLAGEWRYAPRRSWIIQYLLTEEVSEDVEPFDEPTHEFNVGWKAELADGVVFEFSLLENALVVDNSPDFGFHLGLSKRF